MKIFMGNNGKSIYDPIQIRFQYASTLLKIGTVGDILVKASHNKISTKN
jgi:hypothetical protein